MVDWEQGGQPSAADSLPLPTVDQTGAMQNVSAHEFDKMLDSVSQRRDVLEEKDAKLGANLLRERGLVLGHFEHGCILLQFRTLKAAVPLLWASEGSALRQELLDLGFAAIGSLDGHPSVCFTEDDVAKVRDALECYVRKCQTARSEGIWHFGSGSETSAPDAFCDLAVYIQDDQTPNKELIERYNAKLQLVLLRAIHAASPADIHNHPRLLRWLEDRERRRQLIEAADHSLVASLVRIRHANHGPVTNVCGKTNWSSAKAHGRHTMDYGGNPGSDNNRRYT